MKSLGTEKIASQILPKGFDSHIGVGSTSDGLDLSYAYFFDRRTSFIKLENNKNSNVKFIHSTADNSCEFRYNAQYCQNSDDVRTTLIYNPFFLNNITFVNTIKNLLKCKHFSISKLKLETDYVNGISAFIKNQIRPFAGQKNPKILKINIENSYAMASNILCSHIKFSFPWLNLSAFTNFRQSVFSIKNKFGKMPHFSSCFSFVYDNTNLVTFLPEFCVDDAIKRLSFLTPEKLKLLSNISFEKDKLGVKYDSGNKFFLLRHENRIKTTKGKIFDCGLSFTYRADTLRTASVVKYTSENNKLSVSVGKTEDMKISTIISYPFREDIALLTGGVCIGPIPTKYPSKSFCFEIKFLD